MSGLDNPNASFWKRLSNSLIHIALIVPSRPTSLSFFRKQFPTRGYTEYFQHYATTKSINGDKAHEDDIIIKGDDDVVWINSTMVRPFAEYLMNRTDIFLLSASVVNQGLCAYYQQKHGAIPEWVVGEKLPLPGNGMGDMHDNSTQALALHRYFGQYARR